MAKKIEAEADTPKTDTQAPTLAIDLSDQLSDEMTEEAFNHAVNAAAQRARTALVAEVTKRSNKSEGVVRFITSEPAPTQYSIRLGPDTSPITGALDAVTRHLVFDVPSELVERFRRHHHVEQGRLVEVK